MIVYLSNEPSCLSDMLRTCYVCKTHLRCKRCFIFGDSQQGRNVLVKNIHLTLWNTLRIKLCNRQEVAVISLYTQWMSRYNVMQFASIFFKVRLPYDLKRSGTVINNNLWLVVCTAEGVKISWAFLTITTLLTRMNLDAVTRHKLSLTDSHRCSPAVPNFLIWKPSLRGTTNRVDVCAHIRRNLPMSRFQLKK